MNTALAPAGRSAALPPLVIACLAATWLIWGSTYLAIKIALVSLPPFLQMGSRFLVAGGVLMAWMLWRGAPLPSAVQWRNALIVGASLVEEPARRVPGPPTCTSRRAAAAATR